MGTSRDISDEVAGKSQTLRDFNPSGSALVDEIKAQADALINLIRDNAPAKGGRETSLAITNIEQGAMWAVKAQFVK